MPRVIDLRTPVRRLAGSKPVCAAAGAGALASERLRSLPGQLRSLPGQLRGLPGQLSGLPGQLSRWNEAALATLSSRATGYLLSTRSRAAGEYDRLARHGRRVLTGRPRRRRA
jgi:hypothetical protein